MFPRLRTLREEFDRCRSGIDAIEAAPAGDNGDLSDQQQTDAEALYARIDQISPEIEQLAERQRSLSAVSDVLARIAPAAPVVEHTRQAVATAETPSAGEYFVNYWRSLEGDDDARRWVDDYARSTDHARAVALQTTADAGAILPKPIVGDLLSIFDASRPVFNSFTSREMPQEGKTFVRPRITQHVAVAEQRASYPNGTPTEGAELISRKMTLTGDDVTKRTVGGTLQLTKQDIDWTSPSMLQLAIDDFADQYAAWTEAEACAQLVAAATTTSPWVGTDVGTIVSSFAASVQSVWNTSKRMPTTVWLSLDEALALGASTNADDSVTAIAMIRQSLQFVGINLDFVVGPQLPADTIIVGSKLRVESYEQMLGLLTAEIPSRLVREIAYAGYVAFHLRPEGLAKLVAE